VPDPVSERTFLESKLDWNVTREGEHARRLALVTRLLACRAREIVPRLRRLDACAADARADGCLISAWWRLDGGRLHLAANLGDAARPSPPLPGRVLWGERSAELAPWSVVWTRED
jgi:hypothetical protein